MAKERRRSGLGGVAGVFGLLSRRASDPDPRPRPSSQRTAVEIPDPLERMERASREIAKLIEEAPCVAELDARERESLCELAHIGRCHGGTLVWSAGDPAQWVMIVLQGRMEMRARIGPGVEHIVRYHGPGDIVGLEAALGATTYHLHAFATERSAVVRFPAKDLRQIIALGKPAAVKLYASMSLILGEQLRLSTLEVVTLIERSSLMGQRSEKPGSDDPLRAILGKEL